MYENELYRHGIKGQRWGVRRYQNEDGSLKPAGEGRYDDGLRGRARRKAAKSYNYRQGESYKSMSSNEKRKRSNTYNFNKKFYGKTHGLNEVKGGFTTGLRHARAGKQFINSFMGR